MDNTLKFILKRHGIDFYQELPIIIKGSRFKELPKLFRKLGFTKGAEIGVSKGFYSKVLCKSIPNLKLYCIDPWKSYGEYIEQQDEDGQKRLDKFYEDTKNRLKDFDVRIIKKTSMEAIKDFKDDSLDFVFIDGNHSFEYVVEDIAQWSKKVRKGGIIAGHDFWNSINERPWTKVNEEERLRLCQVKDVIFSWTKAHNIRPWFILTEDRCPSWFWVKDK